jgi:hypothetical protein
MSDRAERIEALRRRGEFERETLAAEVRLLTGRFAAVRSRWKLAAGIAGGLAAAGTLGYRLFGPSSPAATLGRIGSVVSVLLGLGRAASRLRKLF